MVVGIPWMFIIVVVVVVILIAMSSRSRTGGSSSGRRVCGDCGAEQPGVAQYCRRCGKKL